MTEGTDNAEVLERFRLAAESGSSRSPLHRWLWSHFDQVDAIIGDTRPNWTRLAEELGSMGFTNAAGGVLSAASVRQIWERVKRRKELDRGKRRGGRPKASALPPVVRPVGAPSSAARPVVTLSKLKGDE